jgi:hypothetical protein
VVLRKVWIGITVDRIEEVWEKHGTLNISQYEFHGHRGADNALLSVINQSEKAKVEHTT